MSNDNQILLCWIPSHVGISGNCQTDKVAGSVLRIAPEKNFKIPYIDLKMNINKYIQ